MLLHHIGADLNHLPQRNRHLYEPLTQLSRKLELYVFCHAGQQRHLDLTKPAQALDHALHQHLRRTRSGRQPDRADTLELLSPQRVRIVDQIAGLTELDSNFRQPVRVGTVF